MRKALAPGPSAIRDLDRDQVTAHVFVEDLNERDQIQRWLLLGSPSAFRAPPEATIRVEPEDPVSGWVIATKEEWLAHVRRSWTEGCCYIKAYFRSYSLAEYTVLPPEPIHDPGFPSANLAALAGVGPLTEPSVAGELAQFDVGTLVFRPPPQVEPPEEHGCWVHRLAPSDANPYFEYWVLGKRYNPAASPVVIAGAAGKEQYGIVADFADAMMARQIWGTLADTFVLGTCYEMKEAGLAD